MIEDANIPHVIWIKDYAEIKVDGQKLILSHYPHAIWNGSHHGSWHLHGHCHGSYHVDGKILDVGIDNHPDHQVFSFDEVREHMGKQEFVVKDHHNGER
jgi:calcineurin-like phosphoesterase family protein